MPDELTPETANAGEDINPQQEEELISVMDKLRNDPNFRILPHVARSADFTQPQADRILVELAAVRSDVYVIHADITEQRKAIEELLAELKKMADSLENRVYWAAGGVLAENHNKAVFNLACTGEQAIAAANAPRISVPGRDGQA